MSKATGYDSSLSMSGEGGMKLRMPSGKIEDYEEIARLVVPTNTPAWLAGLFRAQVGSLFLDRHINKTSRKETREALERIEKAAATLLDDMASDLNRILLIRAQKNPSTDFKRLIVDLRDIELRANLAMQSKALVTKKGVTKAGRGTASSLATVPPITYCAVIIAETWKFIY